MGNPFYVPDEQRAARVGDLFATVAPRYDLLNDLQSFGLHRYWKRRLVRLAALKPGERALDLCCGTGDIALALARSGGQVVGLDFSEPMLAVARKRAEAGSQRAEGGVQSAGPTSGLRPPTSDFQNPRFIRGDALQTGLPDSHFDVVTIGYGLRNLARWDAGLAEMCRVARPGARLLALDFGRPDARPWRALFFAYLKTFVPLLGKIFCGNTAAYAYILESLKHYPAQHGVAAKMKELGLADVRVLNFLGGVTSIHYARKPGLSFSI